MLLQLMLSAHFALHAVAVAPKPAVWDEATVNGTRYYREWQQKSGRDTAFTHDMKDFFFHEVGPTELQPEVVEALQRAHLSTDENNYERVEASWPKDFKDKPSARFYSDIDVKDGIFLVDWITKGKTGFPPNIPYSQIAWYQWTTQCQKIYPGTEPDYSRLSSFWMLDITNAISKSIMAYAIKDYGVGIHPFRPDECQKPGNAFWALLGSPVGRPAIFLLTDNKRAMKEKDIKAIWVDYTTEKMSKSSRLLERYNMWVEIG